MNGQKNFTPAIIVKVNRGPDFVVSRQGNAIFLNGKEIASNRIDAYRVGKVIAHMADPKSMPLDMAEF